MENASTSKCGVQEISEITKLAHEANVVPVFIGESGIGKTSHIRKYAEANNYELVELNCSNLFVEDFGAIRDSNDFVEFHLNRIFDIHKETLIFIDEFSRAKGDLRNCVAALVNERKLYGTRIDDRIKFVIAMNPSNEDYADTDDPFVDLATTRRYAIFNVTASVNDWLAWAKENKITTETISFISQNHMGLLNGQACPRQWEKIDNIFKIAKIKGVEKFAIGMLGSIGRFYLEHLGSNKLITAKDVVRSYATVRNDVKKNKDLQLAIARELVDIKLTAKDKRNIVMFLIDLPNEIRYKAILDLVESKKNSTVIVKWTEENAKLSDFMNEQSSY